MNSNLLARIADPTIANPAQAGFQGAQAGNALWQFANQRQANALAPQAAQGDKNALAQMYAVDPVMADKLDQRQYERGRQALADSRAAAAESRAAKTFDTEQAAAKAERIGRVLYGVETPDQLEAAKPFLAKEGVDVAKLNLADVPMYIKQAQSVKDQFTNAQPKALGGGAYYDPTTGAIKASPTPPRSRTLPQGTIKDLGAAGEGFINLTRQAGTFKDEYAGQPVVGDARNFAGSLGMFGQGDQSAWWADYQRTKNQTRHDLFGSALTATEKAEFDRADINPGMDPTQIRKNLARQQAAATRAAIKMAKVYVDQGYDPQTIADAMGVSLEDLQAPPPSGGGNAPPPAGAPVNKFARAFGELPEQATPSFAPDVIAAEMQRRGLLK
jgi:hypothetical protein